MMKSFGTSPGRCFAFPHEPDDNSLQSSTSNGTSTSTKTNKENAKRGTRRENNSLVYRIHEHVKLGGPKLSETLKCKLSLGARIIQEGGRGNIFKQIFGMQEEEKLLKASQCYLYTTAGPIAGILFISTKKVAFCSERPTSFCSEAGEIVRAPYKVLIPVEKIKEVNESMNVNRLEQKYIEIVTKDVSEFWFMGFLRYEKALRNLKKAVSMGHYCEKGKLNIVVKSLDV